MQPEPPTCRPRMLLKCSPQRTRPEKDRPSQIARALMNENAAYFFWPTSGMPPEAPLRTTKQGTISGLAALQRRAA